MGQQMVGRNKVVYIKYSLVAEDGAVVEQHDIPIGYVPRGNSGLLEKIERALDGRVVGERVEVLLPPEDGFGEHDPRLTFTDDIDNVPPQYRHVGAEVEFQNEQGEPMLFRVTHIADGKLTVDGNPPHAGQSVTCVVDIVDVRDATRDEIASGMPADAAAPPLH
jgi:FKBP-type peptidyl-prolyl cis-trans isomerase SlyD